MMSGKSMKLVAIWLAVLGLIAAVAGSCSVNHRSVDFACTASSECSTGRACIDGFCVTGSAGNLPPDGGAPTVDAFVCPAGCTSCDAAQHGCTIDCEIDPEACNRPVACPAGWACDVRCSTASSCSRGVDCTGSTSCTVSCTGARSCQDVTCGDGACNVDCAGFRACTGVTCGAGSCNVGCSGQGSCSNVACSTGACDVACGGIDACAAVDCSHACACDVACQATSCTALLCPPGNCENAFGCSSQRARCDTCP